MLTDAKPIETVNMALSIFPYIILNWCVLNLSIGYNVSEKISKTSYYTAHKVESGANLLTVPYICLDKRVQRQSKVRMATAVIQSISLSDNLGHIYHNYKGRVTVKYPVDIQGL